MKIACYMHDPSCSGVLLKMQKIFKVMLNSLKSSAVKKYRISTGLCKQVLINPSIVFLDWNNETKLVPALFGNFI